MDFIVKTLLSAVFLTLVIATSTQAITVLPEDTWVQPTAKTAHAEKLSLSPSQFQTPISIQLTPISTDTAKQQLKHSGKKLQIGIPRELPQTSTSKSSSIDQTKWVSVDSTKVMHWEVQSPGARAMRFLIAINTLSKEAIIRFYKPNSGEVVYSIKASQLHKQIEQNRLAGMENHNQYWSPVIEGEVAGMEISIPTKLDTNSVAIDIVQVSHLLYLPGDKDLAEVGASGSCNRNLACDSATWGETGKSVAKMVYSVNGGSFLCTGTLVNDLVDASQIPYFITAQHCISTQASAASLNTYWLFQTDSCFGTAPTSVNQLSGGGSLLATGANADHTLIRLNETPPNGTAFAGWTTDGLTVNQDITGIHHPSGDLKKISFGNILSLPSSDPANSNLTNPIETRWNTGVTEGGSSGSALFNDNKLIIGTLWGGSASCAAPSAPDLYGRFSVAYNDFEQFLGQTTNQDSDAILKNISTRSFVGTGSSVAIAGFIITGNENKDVVIRALGPSISSFVGNRNIPLPKLEVFQNSQLIASNEAWRLDANASDVENAGLAPTSNDDAAIKLTLAPGSYTAVIKDSSEATGIGLVAVDDISPDSDSTLSNISTRAFVKTGDDVTIAGFVIDGTEEKSVVVRGIGPSLASFGVPNALTDTIIEVYHGNALVAENDDWGSNSDAATIQAFGLAPTNTLESALLLNLAPGSYTAILRGFNGSTGVGLIAVDDI